MMFGLYAVCAWPIYITAIARFYAGMLCCALCSSCTCFSMLFRLCIGAPALLAQAAGTRR